MILVIDNYDSFTFNLVQALQAAGADVRVVRNDAITGGDLEAMAADPASGLRGIVISPDGSGGWLLDRSGGMHPFGTGGDPPPPATVGGPYWPGAAFARGAAALP